MKNKVLIFIGIIMGILMTFSFLLNAPISMARAEGNWLQSGATPTPFLDEADEESNVTSLQKVDFSDEISQFGYEEDASNTILFLPTPIPGETLVYFVPTDNDSTATVLNLYNTDSVAHIVALQGYSYNGNLVYSQNINIGATSFLRLVSDPVTRKCVIIDPVLDYDEKSGATGTHHADQLIDYIVERNLTVEWILDTHPHADHFSAAQYLKSKLNAPFFI